MNPDHQRKAAAEEVAEELAKSGAATTIDDFLGGRIKVLQPRKGYRAGIDAVFLAATVSDSQNGKPRVLDCGAGVGTVGLCVAGRLQNAKVIAVERDATLAGLARRNVEANGFENRMSIVELDVTSPPAALSDLGLGDESFDFVVANPPFYDEAAGTLSPNAQKAASHAAPKDAFAGWIKFMTRMAAPGARISIVQRGEAMPRLLSLLENRFGALKVMPLHPRSGEPANRILISGRKGSRAPLQLMPGFVLHIETNAFTDEAVQILRHGGALALGE